MSVSLFSPSRTILKISDDALYIYSSHAKGTEHIETVPWTAEGFVNDVSLILARDCGGKPVLILNDMVEQHYRKERIPQVSVMDRASVVKRKLKLAFSNYPVRAAMPLKEKDKKQKGKVRSDIYLFAAVPMADPFLKTMAAVTKSLAPIAGLGLLPVESADFIKKLSEKLRDKKQKKSMWTVFVGQHKNGSLRQIVIKDGNLALTRMTPISSFDEGKPQWIQEVKQEFQATMSYLSRFGFDSSDGLEIIICADELLSLEHFHDIVQVDADIHVLSLQDIAKKLSLPMGKTIDTHYADLLHVAWSGRKSALTLPMRANQLERVSRPRQITSLLSLLLVVANIYLAYQLANNFSTLDAAKENVEDMRNTYAQTDLQYQVEVKRKAEMGFDIKLIQSSLEIYNNFQNQNIDVLEIFYRIGIALGRDMRIDRIHIERGAVPDPRDRRRRAANTVYPKFIGEIQLTYPSTTDAELGNKEVDALRKRIQDSLPDHKLQVSKYLEDYEYSKELVVETGQAGANALKQDYVAEISIQGPPL